MDPVLTPEQLATLEHLRNRWFLVGKFDFLPREQCVIVPVYGTPMAVNLGVPAMWIGIEADGHAHS